MVWAGFTYGGGTYAGAREVPGSSGGAVITDPANPGAYGWRWVAQTGPAPWAGQAWGGGGQLARATAGGLSAYPDADLGVVNLSAWWTEASYLRIVRVLGDTRTPVRNAYPIVVTGATRRNYCANPSFEQSLSGWLAGANTTLTREIAPLIAFVGGAFGRLKANAAGAVNVTVPVGLPIPEGAMGVSFGLRLSALPSGALTITAAWQDASANALPSSVVTIPSASLSDYVGRWARIPVQVLAPPQAGASGVAAATGTLTVSVAGMASAATADLDAVLIEAATGGGDYFDGDTPYAGWSGTAGGSTSALAQVTRLVDGEAPLDVPFYYELRAPGQPASLIRSEVLTLSSQRSAGGRVTWLSHPADTTRPVRAKVIAAPTLTRAARRGIYAVLGRREPIAVATSVRSSPEGTISVLTETLTERDRLLTMLDDGQPLLLRPPAELGFGPGWWISVGDVSESTSTHYAGPNLIGENLRTVELPFTVVSAPSSASTAAA